MLRKVCFEWYYNDDLSLWLEFMNNENWQFSEGALMILFETNPWQFCLVMNIYSLFSILKNYAFYKMLKSSKTQSVATFLYMNIFEMDRMRIIISRDTHHNNSYLKFSIFYEEIPNLAISWTLCKSPCCHLFVSYDYDIEWELWLLMLLTGMSGSHQTCSVM